MGIFDYPLPSYAAYIWLDDAGNIRLGLPGESGRTHVVRLEKAKCQYDDKAWTAGWAGLLSILKDRAMNGQPKKIGQPGEVTQAQLNEILKSFNGQVQVVGKRNAPANLSLEELDL